jgi:hypothetical protein
VSRGVNGPTFDVANYQVGSNGAAWGPSPVDTPQWRAQIIAPEVLDDPVHPQQFEQEVAAANIIVSGAVAVEVDVALGGVVVKTVPGAVATEIDIGLAGTIKKNVLGDVAVEVDQALAGTIDGGFVPPVTTGFVRLYRNPATNGLAFTLRVPGLSVTTATSGDIDVPPYVAELYRLMYSDDERLYSYEPWS